MARCDRQNPDSRNFGLGSRDLDRAVTSAVLKWRFEPAMKDGKAIAGAVVVPVEFKSR